MIYLKFNPWEKYAKSDCFPTVGTKGTLIFMKQNISLELF